SGAGEQRHRQRDLARDEHGTQTIAAAAARPSAALAQHRVERRARASQRRDETDEQPARQSDDERERENPAVDPRLIDSRDVARTDRDESSEQGIRERDAKHGADHAEHETLDEQLADEARTAGAERGANGQLLGASRAARQEQV